MLLPASDLDVLLIADAAEAELRPFVESILYPLWDSGLKVGHQVRSAGAHVATCRRGELETLTASLTGRVIAGDRVLGERVLDRVAADAHRRQRSTLRRLAERARPGNPFLLEPDLKNGAGGRRDHDELVWTSAVLTGSIARTPDALVAEGVCTSHELGSIREAAGVVAATRWTLQASSCGDRLTSDAVDLLPPNAGEVQHALITTWTVLNRVRRRIAGDTPLAEHTDAAGLFGSLARGRDDLPALQEAAGSGALDSLIPGLGALMAVRRPGMGHTLTVGAHCLATASALTGLAESDPRLARSAALVKDLRPVLTAALVHDIGKSVEGPGHAERGAPVARRITEGMGLSVSDANTVADLVRLHLALVETALHEDLDDEDVILRCAARIGRRELIAPLHLLTAADAEATGPGVRSAWTDALVGQLVSRLDEALAPESDGAGILAAAEDVRHAALGLLPREAAVERTFIESAPSRYLASRSAPDVLGDARLVSGLSSVSRAEQCRIAVSSGPAPATAKVTVAAWDRPFLLSRLAGAFALGGMDILAFDAHGTTSGIAVDVFVVRSSSRRELAPEAFSKLERLLDAALRDRYELATRMAQRRSHYPALIGSEPHIEIRPRGWDTTVSVTAPDRPGLLHDLATAVSATDLDIRWARARSLDGMAHDTFHVVGRDGASVDDPGVLGHLTMRLRSVL